MSAIYKQAVAGELQASAQVSQPVGCLLVLATHACGHVGVPGQGTSTTFERACLTPLPHTPVPARRVQAIGGEHNLDLDPSPDLEPKPFTCARVQAMGGKHDLRGAPNLLAAFAADPMLMEPQATADAYV